MVRCWGWSLLLLAQCAPMPTLHLDYDTSAIAAEPGPRLDASVTIELFEDKRRAHQPAAVFSQRENPVTIDGKAHCVNLEAKYAGTIPIDVRSVTERHLRQRDVVGIGSARADGYVLTGSLLKIQGRQVVPPLSVLGGPVGLALENSLTESSGQVEVSFGDLKITRMKDGSSRRLTDIHVQNDGPLNGVRMGPIWGEPDCSMIFQHVDAHFKKAVEALVVAVEGEIRAWPTSP